jgi:hypothetical protein
LASMIFLLYKPIIGLGPRFALAPDAGHMLCVALTAQPNNGTECLNRIYRLTANALISLSSVPVSPILLPIPFLALSHGLFSKPPLAFAHSHIHIGRYQSNCRGLLCTAASAGFSS